MKKKKKKKKRKKKERRKRASPSNNRGFLPALSIKKMARKVTMMFTIPTLTVRMLAISGFVFMKISVE